MKSIACFDAGLARSATTMQEAERCLLDFIREGVCSDVTHHIREHSCDCDLYLPWFMQVIEYGAPAAVSEPLTIPSLGRLYMDAAWSLVTKGVLRPGPRSVAGGVSANDYGRAFSLFHREQP